MSNRILTSDVREDLIERLAQTRGDEERVVVFNHNRRHLQRVIALTDSMDAAFERYQQKLAEAARPKDLRCAIAIPTTVAGILYGNIAITSKAIIIGRPRVEMRKLTPFEHERAFNKEFDRACSEQIEGTMTQRVVALLQNASEHPRWVVESCFYTPDLQPTDERLHAVYRTSADAENGIRDGHSRIMAAKKRGSYTGYTDRYYLSKEVTVGQILRWAIPAYERSRHARRAIVGLLLEENHYNRMSMNTQQHITAIPAERSA